MKQFSFVIFGIICLGLFLLVLSLGFFASAQDEVMTVEADIMSGIPGGNESIISIQVSDYLYLGNITVGQISDEKKVYMNNTGNVNVTITPELVNKSDEIFANLYFKRILSEPLYKVGEFNFNMSRGARNKYCYIQLDLRNLNIDIPNDLIGQTAQIRFIATEA